MKWNVSPFENQPGVPWDAGLLEALTSQIESVRRDAAYLEAEHQATVASLAGLRGDMGSPPADLMG